MAQRAKESHLCWGRSVCSAALPGALTQPPVLSPCVMAGKSLPVSSPCWSLLTACAAALGNATRHRDLTWPCPCNLAIATQRWGCWTTPCSLSRVCTDAHVTAGKWITRFLALFLPLMLPALRQLSVFRSHEHSRLGSSCDLAEASKESPDVAGSAVRPGQLRTNSVLVGAMALLASSLPNRKLLLIPWWLVATRTTMISHSPMLESECHWPSPVLT